MHFSDLKLFCRDEHLVGVKAVNNTVLSVYTQTINAILIKKKSFSESKYHLINSPWQIHITTSNRYDKIRRIEFKEWGSKFTPHVKRIVNAAIKKYLIPFFEQRNIIIPFKIHVGLILDSYGTSIYIIPVLNTKSEANALENDKQYEKIQDTFHKLFKYDVVAALPIDVHEFNEYPSPFTSWLLDGDVSCLDSYALNVGISTNTNMPK